MRVVPHTQFQKSSVRKKRPMRIVSVILISILLGFGGFGYLQYQQPTPALRIVNAFQTGIPSQSSPITWPATGQAAIGELQMGLLATTENQMPRPTASTAKLITVLTVLNKKPLQRNQPGPTITLTQSDVDRYNAYVANNGSAVAVNAGEQLSQYQMLEGILLPSANNLADSLAIWAYGSLADYAQAANSLLAEWGASNTTVGIDASGLSPTTKSTAKDLFIIAQKAMQHPVISEIVAKKSSTLPVAGTIYNTNVLLGNNGIIGIKTGNTEEAGGAYTFAAKHTIGDQSITLIGCILGAPTLQQAMNDAQSLLQTAKANFTKVSLAKTGQLAAKITVPWQEEVPAVVTKDVQAVLWGKTIVEPLVTFKNVTAPASKNTIVGDITYTLPSGTKVSSPIALQSDISAPNLWQRITLD